MAGNIFQFDIVDANNTSFDGISQADNIMRPSDVPNDVRAKDGAFARWLSDQSGVNTVAGTADVITLTAAENIAAYANRQMLRFIAAATNTTAVTLNVNAIGAKAIRKISGGTDVALAAGDLVAGETYLVVYRSAANAAAGAWVLLGAAAVAAASTAQAGIVELATNAETIAPPVGSTLVPTISTLYYSPGTLYGLTLSNNVSDATNDIDIAVGAARSDDATENMNLLSALTKRLDANWVVGTNQGGLDTGAIANGWYAVWLIKRPDTGVVDVLFSASFSSPTMPTNYTLKRYIGAINRSSAVIRPFRQVMGNLFIWGSVIKDIDSVSYGSGSRTLATLTVPPRRVEAWVQSASDDTDGDSAYLSSPDASDEAATALNNSQVVANTTGVRIPAELWVPTNTSSQIGIRGSGTINVEVNTKGYRDNLGRWA